MFKQDENMKKMKNAAVTEELQELTEISKSMKGLDKLEVKVSKYEFETYLLPYILNEIEHNDINKTVFINNLKDLAGGYRSTILVMDSTEEKVLFKVPPMLINSNIEKLEDRKLRNTIITYEQIAESNPRAADKKLSALTNIIVNGIEVSEDEINVFKDEIKDLLNYYADRIKHNDKMATTGKSNTAQNEDEDFLDELEF